MKEAHIIDERRLPALNLLLKDLSTLTNHIRIIEMIPLDTSNDPGRN